MLAKSFQKGWNKNIEPTIDKADNWADDTANEMNEYFEDLVEKMTRLGG